MNTNVILVGTDSVVKCGVVVKWNSLQKSSLPAFICLAVALRLNLR